MNQELCPAYEIVEKRRIGDLNSEGYILRHKKTGARVVLLENDDENKVFYIGFRTPPKDSTGVAHILEHSVLCGSRKYPVKDPFIQLEKGSLNTFLNAMTYPDKTVYPVASCNDKDFQNLMDVYLDSVFYPNIYKEKGIFMQEGWHYEYDEDANQLYVNGVVYNEMKGAYSSIDDVLSREIMGSLFPDNTYSFESGGDPDVIAQLTYEDFLKFHSTYYHPSNCYIYLYGNMDMAEKLQYIDREYLSAFDSLRVDSGISEQEPFEKPREFTKKYPLGDEEKEEKHTYLSVNYAVGDNLDRVQYVAFQVLDYALCQAPGAPIRKALIDAGVGTEIDSSYDNYVRQPFYSIIAKNADGNQKQQFLDIVTEQLQKCVKEGMDKDSLLAGILSAEFKYREADFGSHPKGLIYGLQILDSWLYDDALPFIHIEANQTYEKLKHLVNEGYFEQLIEKFLLNNAHASVVVLEPEKGLTAKKDQEQKERWNRYFALLDDAGREAVLNQEKQLRQFQEKPDLKENLEKIPLLSRQDMKKEPQEIINKACNIRQVKTLFHDIFTNKIAYFRLIFSLEKVPRELLPYVGVLKGILGLMDTNQYSYAKLFDVINQKTGGITVVNNVYQDVNDDRICRPTLEIKCKTLYENMEEAVDLIHEIMFCTKFQDRKRLYEMIAEGKSRMQTQMTSAAHRVAMNRAMSYFSDYALIQEELNGIPFYRFIEEVEEQLENRADEILENMDKLCRLLFTKENLLLDITATKDGFDKFEECISKIIESLYDDQNDRKDWNLAKEKKNEAFTTAGQVQYVATAGNFKKDGLEYTGALRVLNNMLSCDYLWNQVRVKGGAYGCMCGFGRSGDSYFVSYRDPNIAKTLGAYEQAAKYIQGMELDERELTQYIIGAISDLDVPMTPATKGIYSLGAYMSGITMERLQKERNQLLQVTREEIHSLAKWVESFVSQGNICVVGNGEKIKEEKQLFHNVEALFR